MTPPDPETLTLLATHPAASPARNEALVWLGLLLGLTVVGFLAIMLLRRWYRTSTSGGEPVGFTLHELRQMRDAGQLTDEEFDKARDAMIGRLRSSPTDQDDTDGGDVAPEEASDAR